MPYIDRQQVCEQGKVDISPLPSPKSTDSLGHALQNETKHTQNDTNTQYFVPFRIYCELCKLVLCENNKLFFECRNEPSLKILKYM